MSDQTDSKSSPDKWKVECQHESVKREGILVGVNVTMTFTKKGPVRTHALTDEQRRTYEEGGVIEIDCGDEGMHRVKKGPKPPETRPPSPFEWPSIPTDHKPHVHVPVEDKNLHAAYIRPRLTGVSEETGLLEPLNAIIAEYAEHHFYKLYKFNRIQLEVKNPDPDVAIVAAHAQRTCYDNRYSKAWSGDGWFSLYQLTQSFDRDEPETCARVMGAPVSNTSLWAKSGYWNRKLEAFLKLPSTLPLLEEMGVVATYPAPPKVQIDFSELVQGLKDTRKRVVSSIFESNQYDQS